MLMSRFVALILSIGFFTFSLTSLIHASSVFDKQVDHIFDAMLSDVCIEASPSKKEFFKELWSSDIYRYKSRYSQFSFQLKNTVCLTDAQQVHVEIYLQHSKDRIVLDKHLTYLNQVFEGIVTTNKFSIVFYNYKYKELTNY